MLTTRTPRLILLAFTAALSPLSAAQPGPVREQIDDPYKPGLAPALLSPAYTNRTRAGFTIVQVNVNAQGLNIVGDAANEPSIAVDPTNPSNLAIGWRQFDTIASNFRQAGRAYSTDGGRTWTNPGPLTPGIFRSDPCLRTDSHGTFYYQSLSGDFSVQIFKSTDGGATFPQMFQAFGGDKEWLAIDRTGLPSDGYLYEHYTQEFRRSLDGGMTWGGPIANSTIPVWGVNTVGPDGTVYVGGASGAGGGFPIRVARSTNARNPASTPTFSTATVNLGATQRFNLGPGSPNPAGLLGQVWVDADRSGGARSGWVYCLCAVGPINADPCEIMFSRSTDAGVTWSAPVRVNDSTPGASDWQWFGTMGVAPSGRIDAVFNDTRDSQQAAVSRLYYTFSNDGGATWAPNIPVTGPYNSTIGFPNQNKMGDYYDIHSDNAGCDVAFAATFNGEEDVYYVRIGPRPCAVDLTGDGAVNVADFLAFLQLYSTGSAAADFDRDGRINVADFLAFLSAFAAGC